MTLSVAKII